MSRRGGRGHTHAFARAQVCALCVCAPCRLQREAYVAKNYELALEKWSAALKRRPTDQKLLSNRSAAWLALEEYTNALDDATKLVECHPDWYKGYGRLGAALAALGSTSDAMGAYAKGLELNRDSAVLREELTRLQAENAQAPPPPPGVGDGSGEGGEGGAGAKIALTGLALAKECNKLGRPEQAIRELDKLLTNKVADAEVRTAVRARPMTQHALPRAPTTPRMLLPRSPRCHG
jgi:tetratricopeptide (TPR) repeat protein